MTSYRDSFRHLDADVAAYFKMGDAGKNPFVYAHGNCENSTSGKVLGDFFHSHGHGILMFDLPGHGNSAPFPEAFNPDMKYFSGLLRALVERYCDSDPIVSGHSFGGMVVLDYLASGNKAKSSIVLSTASRNPIEDNPVLGSIVSAIMEDSARSFEGQEFIDFSKLRDEETIHRTGLRHTDLGSLRMNFNATYGYDVRSRLGSVTQPVLILRASEDVFMTHKNNYDMAMRLRNSRYMQIENAGHSFHITHPGELLRILKENYDFLAS